jgi:hypothetical protein
MLPMWILPDGEMPEETTAGRPEAIAAAAAASAQWSDEPPSLVKVVSGRERRARYTRVGHAFNR